MVSQKKTKEYVLKTDNRLMFVKSIAECSGCSFCNNNALVEEHPAILSTSTKRPPIFKTFVLYIFEWPLKTGFTVMTLKKESELCVLKC